MIDQIIDYNKTFVEQKGYENDTIRLLEIYFGQCDRNFTTRP